MKRNKLRPISKYFLLIFLFTFITGNAYAEYYLVYYSGDQIECYERCGPPCYHYIYSKTPYRHHTRGEAQVNEYEWIGDP